MNNNKSKKNTGCLPITLIFLSPLFLLIVWIVWDSESHKNLRKEQTDIQPFLKKIEPIVDFAINQTPTNQFGNEGLNSRRTGLLLNHFIIIEGTKNLQVGLEKYDWPRSSNEAALIQSVVVVRYDKKLTGYYTESWKLMDSKAGQSGIPAYKYNASVYIIDIRTRTVTAYRYFEAPPLPDKIEFPRESKPREYSFTADRQIVEWVGKL